jgi:nucleoside-diphosphate-sugar epimerase
MAGSRLVVLTGATGFIGSRLAAALAQRGDRLRCLVRSASKAARLRDLGAELIEGDVVDSKLLAMAFDGADAACHLAAIYDVGIVDAAEMERVNVGGTRAFLDAAAIAATPRVLYVSTTAALGPGEGEEPDEDVDWKGPYPSVYHRTKAAAHRLARTAQKDGLPLIIVCPAFVYGPGDDGPGGRFLRDIVRARMPGLLADPGWYSYVHVDDVVAGLIAALDAGAPGTTYVLSGQHASINDFAIRAARVAGVRPPLLRLPNTLAAVAGRLLDVIARPTGLRFPITGETVATSAATRWLHGHERATRELGWVPRSLDVGLPEAVADIRRS